MPAEDRAVNNAPTLKLELRVNAPIAIKRYPLKCGNRYREQFR